MKEINWDFRKVVGHISERDSKLADLMMSIGKKKFYTPDNYYLALIRSIIGQQVSTKAAQSIYQKLLDGFGGQLNPETIHEKKTEELRPFGLSQQKASYLLDLSAHFVRDHERFYHLDSLEDVDVIQSLTEIKGIGNWTAQMFLMFTLGRQDVFAPDDLGLKNAMIRLYGWRKAPNKQKLLKYSEKWKPYRSYASRYLWLSLNNSPE